MKEHRADVIQNGQIVARVWGEEFDRVSDEGEHYAMMYGQDGPVEVRLYEKRKGRWRFIGGCIGLEREKDDE